MSNVLLFCKYDGILLLWFLKRKESGERPYLNSPFDVIQSEVHHAQVTKTQLFS